MPEYVSQPGEGAAVQDRQQVERPRRFKVLLLNDHYTTMDFVVMVLCDVYRKSLEEAETIMLHVHENGQGVAGVYVRAIAEAKVKQTHRLARDHGFPLKCTIEPD